MTVTDVQTPPETHVWGEMKRFFRTTSSNANTKAATTTTSESAISIRCDMDANEREIIDLDLRINGFNNNAGIRVLGSAGTYLYYTTCI